MAELAPRPDVPTSVRKLPTLRYRVQFTIGQETHGGETASLRAYPFQDG